MNINKAKLESIRNKHNLSLILLHGSQVDGRTHERSDIDIAVVRSDNKVSFKLLDLLHDLSQVFDSDRVDVSDLTHADPLLLYSATQKSKLLAGIENDYNILLKKAFNKYSDYLPYLKEEEKFVKERIKTYVTT